MSQIFHELSLEMVATRFESLVKEKESTESECASPMLWPFKPRVFVHDVKSPLCKMNFSNFSYIFRTMMKPALIGLQNHFKRIIHLKWSKFFRTLSVIFPRLAMLNQFSKKDMNDWITLLNPTCQNLTSGVKPHAATRAPSGETHTWVL